MDVFNLFVDPLFLASLAIFIAIIIYFVQKTRNTDDDDSNKKESKKPTKKPNVAPRGEGVIRRVRRGRNIGSRRAGDSESDEGGFGGVRREDESEDEDEVLGYDPNTGAKIGAKKQKKLELKAEKRAQRESEVRDREEKKQKDEERKLMEDKLDAKRKADEEAEAERERQEKEEKERKEHEEYLKLKEMFAVEEQGFDENQSLEENQDLLREFINYIKQKKVVILEELASEYKIKTQDVMSRIESLQECGELTGVFDDRGKYIYISERELKEVARFINQRGRVSIHELVESSNNLINLSPPNAAAEPSLAT